MNPFKLLLILCLFLPAPAWAATETLRFQGLEHVVKAELALTQEEQSRGLMYRRQLGGDEGMLFLFPAPRRISMWMKNTLIPLDIVFIDESGTVVNIKENALPGSLEKISSGQPVLAVLEIPGGSAHKKNIIVGTKILSHYFQP